MKVEIQQVKIILDDGTEIQLTYQQALDLRNKLNEKLPNNQITFPQIAINDYSDLPKPPFY